MATQAMQVVAGGSTAIVGLIENPDNSSESYNVAANDGSFVATDFASADQHQAFVSPGIPIGSDELQSMPMPSGLPTGRTYTIRVLDTANNNELLNTIEFDYGTEKRISRLPDADAGTQDGLFVNGTNTGNTVLSPAAGTALEVTGGSGGSGVSVTAGSGVTSHGLYLNEGDNANSHALWVDGPSIFVADSSQDVITVSALGSTGEAGIKIQGSLDNHVLFGAELDSLDAMINANSTQLGAISLEVANTRTDIAAVQSANDKVIAAVDREPDVSEDLTWIVTRKGNKEKGSHTIPLSATEGNLLVAADFGTLLGSNETITEVSNLSVQGSTGLDVSQTTDDDVEIISGRYVTFRISNGVAAEESYVVDLRVITNTPNTFEPELAVFVS